MTCPEAKTIPEILPVLPLIDTALFPKMVVPILAMQKESVQLVDEAMSKDRIIGLIIARETKIKPAYTPDDLHSVGISALILKMAKSEDNTTQLLVQGLSRFRVKDFIKTKPIFRSGWSILRIKKKKTRKLMR